MLRRPMAMPSEKAVHKVSNFSLKHGYCISRPEHQCLFHLKQQGQRMLLLVAALMPAMHARCYLVAAHLPSAETMIRRDAQRTHKPLRACVFTSKNMPDYNQGPLHDKLVIIASMIVKRDDNNKSNLDVCFAFMIRLRYVRCKSTSSRQACAEHCAYGGST